MADPWTRVGVEDGWQTLAPEVEALMERVDTTLAAVEILLREAIPDGWYKARALDALGTTGVWARLALRQADYARRVPEGVRSL